MKFPIATGAISLPLLLSKAVARVQMRCKPDRDEFCNGINFNTSLTRSYTCGNPRLGPGEFLTRWFYPHVRFL